MAKVQRVSVRYRRSHPGAWVAFILIAAAAFYVLVIAPKHHDANADNGTSTSTATSQSATSGTQPPAAAQPTAVPTHAQAKPKSQPPLPFTQPANIKRLQGIKQDIISYNAAIDRDKAAYRAAVGAAAKQNLRQQLNQEAQKCDDAYTNYAVSIKEVDKAVAAQNGLPQKDDPLVTCHTLDDLEQ